MSKGKAVSTEWKKALEQQATDVANAKPETMGIPQISLAGGRMSLADNYIPGDELQVIIIADTLERAWYDRPYDPDDKSPPDCFALGPMAKELAPHENVPEKNRPSHQCHGCPMAEFGTAIQGKGPACKTRVRLLVMPVPNDVTADMVRSEEAELAIYKTQPTSVVNFSGLGGAGKRPGYKRFLAEQGKTPWAVVTQIKLRPHKARQHETLFELARLLPDEVVQAAYSRTESAQEAILQPFQYPEEEEGADAPTATAQTADGARY